MELTDHVLILGGSGLIGSQLANVIRLHHPQIKLTAPSSKQIDLRQPQCADQLGALLTPQTVVVMAAGIKRQRGDNLDTLEANINMVVNLARALERYPVRKVVFLSTTAVYGEGIHNLTIDEATPIALNSYYGVSKYTGESILDRLISQQPAVSLLTVRLPLVYGVGDHAAYAPSGFLTSALRGETIVLWGSGTELREFLFVEDVAEILCRLCLSSAEGIVNLVSGTSYNYI